MKKYLLLFLVIAPLIVSTAWHKYYLSVSQVDYDEKSKSLQIITRIFYDDVEKALQARYDESIKVDKTYPKEKLNKYLERYLNQKFKVTINEEDKNISYLGFENEDEYVVCYIEVTDVPQINSITIENSLLMEVFSDQKNVVHLNVEGTQKSFLLISGNDKAVLNFPN
tara:strand:- start:588 stop:1091 length:504 start_codon:yes stop_codon:yes gene_type:complete